MYLFIKILDQVLFGFGLDFILFYSISILFNEII